MFWAIAVALAGIVTVLIVLALLRDEAPGAAEAADVRIYRDQLDEVERDLARGTLSADEADRVRIEVSRRLIDADRADEIRRAPGSAPRAATLTAAGIAAILVIGGGVLTYGRLGAPGYPDLPLQTRIEMANAARESRPDQAAAEAAAADFSASARAAAEAAADPSFLGLMEKLRKTLEDRPDDLEGHVLLARNEAGLSRFAQAAAAQARVIALKGDDATADDHADLAEYLIYAAGGYVSPEAETALTAALRLDTGAPRTRYYSGLLYAQNGRPDLAFRLWRALLESGPRDAPWIAPIRAQIADLAALAGVRYALPAAPDATRGPDAADLAAAAALSPAERDAMVEGMVAQLSDRLAQDGGPPEDWARLIGALGVLGRSEQARAIWTEAREVFAAAPDAINLLRESALRAGLTE